CCACVSFIGLNDIAAQTVKRYLVTREGLDALMEHGVVSPAVEFPAKGRVGTPAREPKTKSTPMGKRQRAALEFLALRQGNLATANDIYEATNASHATIKSLAARGWVDEIIHEVNRPDSYGRQSGNEPELSLSAEQSA